MPLHINLLHEEQSKIVERKRDPLKLGILALLFIALCFYGYYFFQSQSGNKLASSRAELEAQLAKLQPQAQQQKAAAEAGAATVSATSSIVKMINDRFYWGPMLNEIVVGTGPEIQLTSFDGSVRGGGSVSLTIAGVSTGTEPRGVAEKFRQNMQERLKNKYGPVSSQFNTLENNDTPLILNGKSYATANFSIGVQITLNAK